MAREKASRYPSTKSQQANRCWEEGTCSTRSEWIWRKAAVYCPTRCFGFRPARSTDPLELENTRQTAESERAEWNMARLHPHMPAPNSLIWSNEKAVMWNAGLTPRFKTKQNKSDHELDMASFLPFTPALWRLRQQDCKWEAGME